ncbi:DUF6702 family protein [Moheibacter stercoris]|uniref:Auto-transporter adhesin head GIN domain-containing protein n=1 Tax=Moheibacter stercoris TaxID=1628251 RepID=A0ABV2LR60_9FLAO
MKNFNYIVVLIGILGVFGYSFMQDFHASTTKVDYENGTLKLTAKFFTSDLEKAIGASVNSKDAFDSKAKSYTSSKLTVKVNGASVPLTYVGSQTNDKSTRLYLKADNISNIKELDVTNSMLIETFSDQQNLVTFDVNGVRKSFTAKKGNDSGKVTF